MLGVTGKGRGLVPPLPSPVKSWDLREIEAEHRETAIDLLSPS